MLPTLNYLISRLPTYNIYKGASFRRKKKSIVILFMIKTKVPIFNSSFYVKPTYIFPFLFDERGKTEAITKGESES